MADMDWVRRTQPKLTLSVIEHMAELEAEGHRHVYTACLNRIQLLLEHIEKLEEQPTMPQTD